jgi:hypothetical protein
MTTMRPEALMSCARATDEAALNIGPPPKSILPLKIFYDDESGIVACLGALSRAS